MKEFGRLAITLAPANIEARLEQPRVARLSSAFLADEAFNRRAEKQRIVEGGPCKTLQTALTTSEGTLTNGYQPILGALLSNLANSCL
jgi:hypothetical protein